MQLQEIQQILSSEKFETLLQPANEEVALDQLFVVLEGDTQNFLLELAYIPNLDHELENTQLLQFFVSLPCEVKPAEINNLREVVLRLNVHTPLMGWGFNEEQNLLYFRHILVLSKQPNSSSQEVLVEVVWLIFYLLESFYPTILQVARDLG